MISGLVIPDFDEASHTYRLDGKVLPSITTVLKAVGIIDTSHHSESSRDRGTAVHRACHLLADGDLDMATVEPELVSYLDAYKMFCTATGFRPDILEQPLANRTYGYAGTPDQVQTGQLIVDLKSGSPEGWHALQLAAQAFLLPGPFVYDRWAVYLMDTGKYSLKIFPKTQLMSDFGVFSSALNISNWRKHGN